jgi:hypothetical protein
MKRFVNFERFAGSQPNNRVACLVTAFLMLSIAVGCSKSNSPAPAAPPAAANSPAVSATSAPAPAPTPVATAQPAPAANATNSLSSLQVLNRTLLGWMIRNRRHPKDFQEFASTANIQIPAPPPGKKYALNGRGFIVLVDNSTQ